MEQTIGKRIAQHRKRLELTQDALAEKLGVTAQAVSKWENDQSCPDITMLPRLAEIFGITTDELLGREQPVHEAEVIRDNESEETDGVHVQKGNWEFRWDSGKREALGFAVFVLLVGGLLLVNEIFLGPANFWQILWPSALLVYGVFGLIHRFSFWKLGSALFGGYFLVVNLGGPSLNLDRELVFPVILVLFGLSLFVDALRKPRKPRFHVSRNGVKLCDENGNHKKGRNEYTTDGESFECNISFGDGAQTVQLPRLSEGEINISFGALTLDLSGCEEIADGCELEANCSFGELVILVPRHCRVVPESSTTFASINIVGEPNPDAMATIHLEGNASFGEITVRYI